MRHGGVSGSTAEAEEGETRVGSVQPFCLAAATWAAAAWRTTATCKAVMRTGKSAFRASERDWSVRRTALVASSQAWR